MEDPAPTSARGGSGASLMFRAGFASDQLVGRQGKGIWKILTSVQESEPEMSFKNIQTTSQQWDMESSDSKGVLRERA